MAYYLDVPNFTGRFVTVNIPAPTNSSGYNFEFEFECQANSTDLILNGTSAADSSDIFFLKASVVEYRRTGNSAISMTHGVTISAWNNYRFVFTGSGAGNIAFYVNGVFKANYTPSASIATPSFAALLQLSSATRVGKFRFFKFTDFNNSASNRMYDARAYVSGDTVLRETANGFNGSFTDNSSAWGARPPAFIDDGTGGGTAPTGTVTIGTITKTSTTATVPYTYSAADQTGFEYRLNGGSPASDAASPVNLTGLTASTAYTVEVRAVNATGAGAWSTAANFTTDAAGAVPQGTVTIGSITTTQTTASVPYTYSLADQTGFQYRLNGGTTTTATASPQSLTGLTAGTAYTIEIRAVNATGNGTWSAVANFTTASAATINLIDLASMQKEPWASQSGITCDVYNPSTGALVVRKTGLTSTAGADVSFTDAALTAATNYTVVISFDDKIGVAKVTT